MILTWGNNHLLAHFLWRTSCMLFYSTGNNDGGRADSEGEKGDEMK